jgi:hypothetical protein
VSSPVLVPGKRLARDADQHAHAAVRSQREWLVPLGRAGYAAKGFVYLVVGGLAAKAALGQGGETTDSRGALAQVLQVPHGEALMLLLAVGLAGYAVWCALAALVDTDHRGQDVSGLVQRIGQGVTTVVYASLAATAIGFALGSGGQANGDQEAQDRTAWLMSHPFGQWLVGAVGLIVIGVGVSHLVLAARASFERELESAGLSSTARDAVLAVGRIGYAAHGVTLGIVGVFVVVAAVQSQPEQARGLGGALAALLAQPFGPALLACVAVGLAAYGATMLVMARYRRMLLS